MYKFQKDQYWKNKHRLGNVLLQQMHQKVPDSGTWGVSSAPANQVGLLFWDVEQLNLIFR